MNSLGAPINAESDTESANDHGILVVDPRWRVPNTKVDCEIEDLSNGDAFALGWGIVRLGDRLPHRLAEALIVGFDHLERRHDWSASAVDDKPDAGHTGSSPGAQMIGIPRRPNSTANWRSGLCDFVGQVRFEYGPGPVGSDKGLFDYLIRIQREAGAVRHAASPNDDSDLITARFLRRQIERTREPGISHRLRRNVTEAVDKGDMGIANGLLGLLRNENPLDGLTAARRSNERGRDRE
jgi:hypothetical protein